MLNLVLLTKENLIPSEIENMDCYDWDVYLVILNEYSKGQEYKHKQETTKIKSKTKKR